MNILVLRDGLYDILVMNFEIWNNECGYSVIYKDVPVSISVYEKSILELVRKKKLLKINNYENKS